MGEAKFVGELVREHLGSAYHAYDVAAQPATFLSFSSAGGMLYLTRLAGRSRVLAVIASRAVTIPAARRSDSVGAQRTPPPLQRARAHPGRGHPSRPALLALAQATPTPSSAAPLPATIAPGTVKITINGWRTRTPSNVCRQRTAFPSWQRPETPQLSVRLAAEAPLGATR